MPVAIHFSECERTNSCDATTHHRYVVRVTNCLTVIVQKHGSPTISTTAPIVPTASEMHCFLSRIHVGYYRLNHGSRTAQSQSLRFSGSDGNLQWVRLSLCTPES